MQVDDNDIKTLELSTMIFFNVLALTHNLPGEDYILFGFAIWKFLKKSEGGNVDYFELTAIFIVLQSNHS